MPGEKSFPKEMEKAMLVIKAKQFDLKHNIQSIQQKK